MDFDVDRFIAEIENRPSLWNMACTDYSDRVKRIKQWEEVVELFSDPQETEDDKRRIGRILQKRWRNLRDSFMRECRRLKSQKKGSSSKVKYKYYEQLLFLLPFATNSEPRSRTFHSIERQRQSESHSVPYYNENNINALSPRKKKKSATAERVGRELVGAIKSTLQQNISDEDPDRHFMLSLLDDFKRVPSRLKPTVKINILKCIMEAQDENYDYKLSRPEAAVEIFVPNPQGGSRKRQREEEEEEEDERHGEEEETSEEENSNNSDSDNETLSKPQLKSSKIVIKKE